MFVTVGEYFAYTLKEDDFVKYQNVFRRVIRIIPLPEENDFGEKLYRLELGDQIL